MVGRWWNVTKITSALGSPMTGSPATPHPPPPHTHTHPSPTPPPTPPPHPTPHPLPIRHTHTHHTHMAIGPRVTPWNQIIDIGTAGLLSQTWISIWHTLSLKVMANAAYVTAYFAVRSSLWNSYDTYCRRLGLVTTVVCIYQFGVWTGRNRAEPSLIGWAQT